MAKYNINNVKTDTKFLEFIEKEYGYSSFSEIPPFEAEALLYKFRSKENDLNNADGDFDDLDDYILSNSYEHEDELKQLYFGDKNAQLSPEDTVFLTALSKTMKDHAEFSIDDVRQHKTHQTEAKRNTARRTTHTNTNARASNSGRNPSAQASNSDRNPSARASNLAELRRANKLSQKRKKETQLNNNGSNIPPFPEELVPNFAENANSRIRSDHNLSNEHKLALVRLDALQRMNIISQADYDKYAKDIESDNLKTVQDAFEFVDNAEDKVKNQASYRDVIVNILLSQNMIDLMTPELTVVAYDSLTQYIEKNRQNKSANIPALEEKLKKVLAQMDTLQSDFKNKRGFYLLDVTNVADAYDGYSNMFEVRQQDLEIKNKSLKNTKQNLNPQTEQAKISEINQEISTNEALKNEYSQSEQDLDEIIATYDERWNIPSARNPKDTAIKFNDRVKAGSKILSQIKFDEDTLGEELLSQISQFKFNDKNGQPIPQFIDPKNPNIKSDVWRKGLEVNPEGELATVLKLAGNDVLMENLGSKEKITQESFVQQLKDNVPFKLFEMYNSEEIIRGAVEDPEKFTTKKAQYLAEFEAKLNNPQTPLSISTAGYQAALDDQVNKVEVFTNRLNKKLGKNNAEFTNSVLFEQIQSIDKQAPNRGRKSKDVKKGALKRAIWGVAMGGTMAYVGSRLITNAAATGGISLIGSSALALGTAITVGAASTALQIWSRKKAAKARGEKYGWKEFKKDRMLHASIATTTLACASAAFAMANAPELSIPAAACAIGSFGIGTGLRFAQPYRDMRLKGHNRLTAFALGAANAAAVLAGGYYGRQDGLHDIKPNTHEVIDDYKDVKVGEVKTYSDDQIAKVTARNNTNSMWEYRGEGPHDIPAYRNPDNYSNDAWWTPEQHDKAISALKEQMPKLGWKEGVGNEEVMLRKLASFERLHRNSDFVLPDGKTVGEKFGDYKSLLDGLLEGKLTPEGAKQLDVIQYNVGENGHSKILDSLGSELYSYKDHPHGIQIQDDIDTKPIIKTVEDEVTAPAGGVFGWVVSSWNKFKNKIRPGAKADKVGSQDKIPVVPPAVTPDKTPVVPPAVTPNKTPDKTPPAKTPDPSKKFLLDEYKIVYGIEPDMTPGKDKAWKDYCNRVEVERQAEAPEQNMTQYLLLRRARLDKVIEENVPGDTEMSASGKPIRKDYYTKQMTDSRDKAAIVMEARQSLMQSNLTKDNFANKITLSHFTKYISHFAKKDNVVADASRDISLNPKMKEKYTKPESNVEIVDLNKYIAEGKPLEQSIIKSKGKDVRDKMKTLNKNYSRSNKQETR